MPDLAVMVGCALLFLLSATLFEGAGWGLLTAGLFLLTPLLVLHSGLDTVLLPFVAGWMVALARFERTPRARWLLLGGIILALGLYRGDAALVGMPMYVVLTVTWLSATADRPMVAGATFLGGFAVGAAPLAVTMLRDPGFLAAAIVRLGIYDARSYGVFRGVRELLTMTGLAARSDVYYGYFNPVFLFLQGRTLLDALRHPPMLLLPMAVLVPVGAYDVVTNQRRSIRWVILGAALLAPMVAALRVVPNQPDSVILMLPSVAVLATFGARQLLASRVRVVRLVGLAALAAVPLAFAIFYANLP